MKKDENWDKGDHPCPGEKDEVRTHYTGNCPACTDGRNLRTGLGNDMGHTSPDAAEQIEDEVTYMPQHILNIVAKDPEIEHVPDNMEPPSMEKQRTEEGEENRNRIKSFTGEQEKELGGDDTKMKDEVLEIRPKGYLIEKNHDVKNDERYIDKGKGAGRYVILEGNHSVLSLSNQGIGEKLEVLLGILW